MTQAEKALANARKVEQEKLRTPTETLRFQKQLLGNIRRLETVSQQLSSARVELAALIYVPPSTKFRVITPLTSALIVPKWSVPLDEMDTLAFHNNPDIREKFYLSRISMENVKKSLVGFLPGIDLSAGVNSDSNSFLEEDHWFQWSAALSRNLFKLLSLPAQMRHNDAQTRVSEAQRIALRMAVLAQVHLVDKQYVNAVRQFERADEIFAIDTRLSNQIAKRQESSIQSLLERIFQETAAIDSELRRYQTYSDVIEAVARIHSTLGIRIISSKDSVKNLNELTQAVSNAMKDWMNGSAINAEVKRLEVLKSKETHEAKSTDYGGDFAAVSAWAQQETSTVKNPSGDASFNAPPPAVTGDSNVAFIGAGAVIVGRGDTVYGLARRHRVSVRAIIEATALVPPYHLNVGQRVVLPRRPEHVVERGDTLYAVARQNGVVAYDVARLNNLKPPYTIHVGQSLVLPDVGRLRTAPVSRNAEGVTLPSSSRVPTTTRSSQSPASETTAAPAASAAPVPRAPVATSKGFQ